jgi:PAS domain S-box-containing protein
MAQPLQILHLEDSSDDAALLRKLLRGEGLDCQIVCVNGREEFLTAVTNNRWDIILADYALPTFDGQSALLIAQAVAPDVPFIFVSGVIGEDEAIEGLKAGATDYVFKHRLSRLAPAIRRALREVEVRAERQGVVETLAVRARQQAAVAELGQQALASTHLPQLLDQTVTLITHTLGVAYCKILQCRPDGETLLLIAGTGWREGVIGRLVLEGGPYSQSGYTLASEGPIIVEDLLTETRFQAPPILREHNIVSGMSVIIPGRERPFGVLTVHSDQKRIFTTDDINFLQSAAHILASAIERKEREEELNQSRNQMQAILRGITEGIIVQTAERAFIYANETAAHLSGYPSVQALLSVSPHDFIRRHDIMDEEGQPFPADQLPGRLAWRGYQPAEVLLRVRPRDGGVERWLVFSATPVLDDAGQVQLVVNIFRDVTERTRLYQAEKEARQMAEATTARLTALQQVTTAFSQALTPTEVVQVVIEHGVASLGASSGSVVMRREGSDMLEVVRAIGYPPEVIATWRSFPLDAPIPLATTVRTGQPTFIENLEGMQDYPQIQEVARQLGNQSWATIPLQIEGRIIGALGLSFATPQHFTEHYRSFMLSLGWQCTQALERARLYDAESKARTQAEIAHRRVQFLAEASGLLSSSLDYVQTLREIARLSVPRIADWAVVWLADDANHLELVAIGYSDAELAQWVVALLAHYAAQPNVPVQIASLLPDGRSQFYADFATFLPSLLEQHDFSALLEAVPLTSLLFVPMTVRGQTLGVLGLAMAESARQFSRDDLALAEELARHAAMAVDNARLYWETNRLNLELEQRVARRTAQLEASNLLLRRLTQRVVTVQEEERHRISRELHDEAGQALTALKISLGLIQKNLPPDLPVVHQRLVNAIELTNETMSQIRLLAHDLRPPSLDSFGLDPTLEGFCQEFAKRTQLKIHYQGTKLPPLSGPVNITFYRLVQEALTNVVRHAMAREVHVELSYDGREIILQVSDDGAGFDIQAALMPGKNKPGGSGLLGMQERLDLLSGWLNIDSQPGKGTRLTASVPLSDAHPNEEIPDAFSINRPVPE